MPISLVHAHHVQCAQSNSGGHLRTHLLGALLFSIAALIISPATPSIAQSTATAMGIDVDFYTGPISHDVWLQIKMAGQQFAIVQAWGGRSRNEFAVSQ